MPVNSASSAQPEEIAWIRDARTVTKVSVASLFQHDDLKEMHTYAIFCANVYLTPEAAVDKGFGEEDCKSRHTRHPKPKRWDRYANLPAFPTTPSWRYRIKGLKYEVWENKEDRVVLIVFRGTVPKLLGDWYSNFRWATRLNPFSWDQYDQIRAFIPKLVNHIRKKYDNDVTIVAAGHSLGGGQAQQAAYASKYIKRVYAYNSSPVTGFRSVKRGARNENKRGVCIYRLFEHREILAYIRFVLRQVYFWSSIDPKILEVRFNFGQGNFLKEHSMKDFACGLKNALPDAMPSPTPEAPGNSAPPQ